ncbi:MAG: AraC family transcriptional regulator [Polaromonas sp.]
MTVDQIASLCPWLQRLAHLGVDLANVLHRVGLLPTAEQQAPVAFTTGQYFALWAAIEAVSGDSLIGLRIGGAIRPDQLDPASIAALHSSTFREAMTRLARYMRLSCAETIRMVPVEGNTRISLQWTWAKGQTPNSLKDAAFANAHLLLRCGTGKDLAPQRIDLMEPRADLQRYARHFGCEVRVGAPHDALVYASQTLDERFVTSNPALIAALLPGLDMQLAAVVPQPLDQQVKAVLTKMMRGERPSMEAVAHQLCLSPRTLQRRLTDAQTSYQAILDAVRLDTACKLLGHTALEPGEIAFYLGFEEVNSFLRAFNKWQGMTPTQWRAQASIAPPVLTA